MLLGGVGMGYFGCAYGLFLPIYALSITGLSTAVASLVAKEHGAGHIQNVRKIRRTARLLFAGMGLLLSGFIWLFAVPFARSTAADASAAYAIRMMAPAAFFGVWQPWNGAIMRGFATCIRLPFRRQWSPLQKSHAACCSVTMSLRMKRRYSPIFQLAHQFSPLQRQQPFWALRFPLPAASCISFSAIWAAMGCQRLLLPPLHSRLARSCGRCFKSCCRCIGVIRHQSDFPD